MMEFHKIQAQTKTSELAKSLLPFLIPVTENEYTVTD